MAIVLTPKKVIVDSKDLTDMTKSVLVRYSPCELPIVTLELFATLTEDFEGELRVDRI